MRRESWHYAVDDTIAAVASAPGRSPRGIVRLSGPAAFDVLDALLEGARGRGAGGPSEAGARENEVAHGSGAVADTLPHRSPVTGHQSPPLTHHPPQLLPARLRTPPIPVLVATFHTPRGFTGQDAAELQLPGHPALLSRVLDRCLAAGARLAEPGEFTFRAFAAGRLDLTRAEGVAATIAAESDGQLRAASQLRRGRLGGVAEDLIDRLGTLLALTEAGIDFVDQEDVVPIAPGRLLDGVAEAKAKIDDPLSRSRPWADATALPRVVLMGPPSSGKSTLFNALLGRSRAVIDATAGTTRDALAEPMTLERGSGPPLEVMLVDVAGLDDALAALDRAVQAAARREIDRADVVLRLHAPDTPTPMRLTPPASAVTIEVHTKADLTPAAAPGALAVSAVTGANLDALRGRLTRALADAPAAGDALALQPRHERALADAAGELDAAVALLEPQRHDPAIARVELVAGRLRAAVDALAALGGRLSPDDVIGRVFATFCVGK